MKCVSSKSRLLGAFFVSFLFIIPSKCILQMKQTRSVLTLHLRRRNSNMLGTNKKLREGFSRIFSPAGRSPKILKPRSCYGNSISARKFYSWHLSITNIFTWCMSSLSFFCVCVVAIPRKSRTCADFPRGDKQRVVAPLWMTKLNKHLDESLRVKPLRLNALFVFTL